MRPDMSKVLVERPRLRFPLENGSAYPRGHLKNRWAPHWEEAPKRESMGGSYAEKRLNENLAPLARFLRSRVGRPWNDVHAEIAAQLSVTSAVQKHVLDHLRDYVTVVVFERDGELFGHSRWGAPEPVSRRRLYVDPRSGLLARTPDAPRRRKGPPLERDRVPLSEDRELWRVDGIWYAIDVAPIPRDPATRRDCFDVLARTPPLEAGASSPLWPTCRYAARKRQLGGRELRLHRLRNER